MMSRSSTSLVHGVVAATSIDRLRGVKDVFGFGAVEIHVEDDLALVVSAVPKEVDIDATFADQGRVVKIALAHHEVLAEICVTVDVVPVRLGSLISSEQTAHALIREQGERFRTQLVLITGTVEFSVVVSDSETQPIAVQASRDGRSYLRARAGAVAEIQMRPQRVEATIAAVAALLAEQALSQANRCLPRPEAGAARRYFDATYLVERGLVGEFLGLCQAVPGFLADDNLALAVRGPWPAYSLTGELESLS